MDVGCSMKGPVMMRQTPAKAMQELQWHVYTMTLQMTHVTSASSPLPHSRHNTSL